MPPRCLLCGSWVPPRCLLGASWEQFRCEEKDADRPYESAGPSLAARSLLCVRKRRILFPHFLAQQTLFGVSRWGHTFAITRLAWKVSLKATAHGSQSRKYPPASSQVPQAHYSWGAPRPRVHTPPRWLRNYHFWVRVSNFLVFWRLPRPCAYFLIS